MLFVDADGAIIDGDRALPVVFLDGDIAYAPGPDDGAVASVTLDAVRPSLADAGIELRHGRLTADMVAAARALVLLGSGVGAVGVSEVDGAAVGDDGAVVGDDGAAVGDGTALLAAARTGLRAAGYHCDS